MLKQLLRYFSIMCINNQNQHVTQPLVGIYCCKHLSSARIFIEVTLNNLKQIIIPAKNSLLVLEVLLVSLEFIFYLPDYPQAVMGIREELVTAYSVQLEWAYQMNGSSSRTGVAIA